MTNSNGAAETLVMYREAAIRAAASATTDPDESNKWANVGIECFRTLRITSEGKSGIIALMSDESPYVRGLAAAHSLQWVPETARGVLESIRDGDGPGAFEAKWTLIEFDNGTMSFDY